MKWILIFLLLLALRYLLFEVVFIPSGSMENSLLIQDRVLCYRNSTNIRFLLNKILYFTNNPKNKNDFIDNKSEIISEKPIKINRGDIIIFKISGYQFPLYIKRCVGLPGDNFEIINEITFCNFKPVGFPSQAKLRYKVWINKGYEFASLLNANKINTSFQFKDSISFCEELELTSSQFLVIKNADCIDSVSHVVNIEETIIRTFPYSDQFNWSMHNFGPIVIPKRGMKIDLNRKNFKLYEKVINKNEKQNICFENGLFFKDGTIISSYIFKQNYYFVLGDNRQISTDSRSWGFIPEEDINGKAILVLYSFNNDKFRWDRFLKKIE